MGRITRRAAAVLVVLVLALAAPGLARAVPQGSAPARAQDAACFPETGQCLRGRFLAYWQTHGGLTLNGYPLTEERTEVLEDGMAYLVQYCERVRLEYHPEHAPPHDVLLGQFGRLVHPADPPVAPDPQAGTPGVAYFAATGHNVRDRFLAHWQAHGGLAQFGYPLSEELTETLEDGR